MTLLNLQLLRTTNRREHDVDPDPQPTLSPPSAGAGARPLYAPGANPMTDLTGSAQGLVEDPRTDDLAKSRLLIVDDDRGIREVLHRALAGDGHAVKTASTTGEALEILRKDEIHVMLSDINMPGPDGIELLRQARSQNPDVQVVMATAIADTETAVGALRDGASDYLTKPFKMSEVRLVVQRCLERRRLVLENRALQERLETRVAEQTRELREKKHRLEKLNDELKSAYESTLQALMTAIDFCDHETLGHSLRVVEYSTLIARKMGVVEPELTAVRWGAILHDIGKIGISDAILRKPGKLNEEEWEELRKHPTLGLEMLRHIPFLNRVVGIVYSHHERWDGKGYPRGLSGRKIPLGARVFAVVDTFDAMTSDRPYRKALPVSVAREEIRACSGTQFDPRVAAAFAEIPDTVWAEIRENVHRQACAAKQQLPRIL